MKGGAAVSILVSAVSVYFGVLVSVLADFVKYTPSHIIFRKFFFQADRLRVFIAMKKRLSVILNCLESYYFDFMVHSF